MRYRDDMPGAGLQALARQLQLVCLSEQGYLGKMLNTKMLNTKNTQPSHSRRDATQSVRNANGAAMVRQLVDVMHGRSKMPAEEFMALVHAANKL
jgi:hypothetical protein